MSSELLRQQLQDSVDGKTEPSPAPEGTSPLAEADPNSLNDLIEERIADILNEPPLTVSDAKLAKVVAYYRLGRARFAKESAEKAAAGPRRKAAAPKSVAEALAAAQRPKLVL